MCQKQSYLGQNFLYFSKKPPKTNLKLFWYQISPSVKIPEKQLPSKADFRTWLPRNYSNLGQNSVKGLRVTKKAKDIKFEGLWGELESKIGFQRQ